MLPPRRINFKQDKNLERDFNFLFSDIYERLVGDAPKVREEWKKLKTADEKFTFIAKRLGLE